MSIKRKCMAVNLLSGYYNLKVLDHLSCQVTICCLTQLHFLNQDKVGRGESELSWQVKVGNHCEIVIWSLSVHAELTTTEGSGTKENCTNYQRCKW